MRTVYLAPASHSCKMADAAHERAPDVSTNDLGATDIALNPADPTAADKSSATRAFQLTWSGMSDMWTNPSSFVPIQFCPQASPPANQ